MYHISSKYNIYEMINHYKIITDNHLLWKLATMSWIHPKIELS